MSHESAEGRAAPPGTHMTGVELFVADVERSVAFYVALGFRVVRRREDWVDLEHDGAHIVLQGDAHAVAGPHYFTPHIGRRPRGTGVEIVVPVSDVDALYRSVRQGGLDIVKAIQDRPWGARDYRVVDPDGYFVRLTSPLPNGRRRPRIAGSRRAAPQRALGHGPASLAARGEGAAGEGEVEDHGRRLVRGPGERLQLGVQLRQLFRWERRQTLAHVVSSI